MLSRNAVFCSLAIKDVSKKSKFHKGIHSTDRDKILNINLRSTDVYKKIAAGLVKSYPLKMIYNLNADYHVKPHHAAL